MPKVRATVKPEILVWARESAGLSLEEAAKKLGNVKPERLARWEQGPDKPTISQLRTMAQVYKRPLSVFYLQEAPTRFRVMEDFRRLPGVIAGRYSPPLRLEIRRAQERRQLALEFGSGARLAFGSCRSRRKKVLRPFFVGPPGHFACRSFGLRARKVAPIVVGAVR